MNAKFNPTTMKKTILTVCLLTTIPLASSQAAYLWSDHDMRLACSDVLIKARESCEAAAKKDPESAYAVLTQDGSRARTAHGCDLLVRTTKELTPSEFAIAFDCSLY